MLETKQEQLPQLPEGYTVRPATMDDIEGYADLVAACNIEQYGDPMINAERIRSEWKQSSFNLESSTRLIEAADGSVVALAELWDTDAIPVHIWNGARVHPEHRGRGLGTWLLRWSTLRAQEAIDRCPPEARVALFAGCQKGFEPAETLLTAEGFKATRHWWTMRIDRPDDVSAAPQPVFPDGITVRSMRYPEDFRDTAWAANDAFKDHWGHVDQPFEKDLEQWRDWIENNPDFDPAVWFIAIDEARNEIAGVSLCEKIARNDPKLAVLDTLGVRRDWRRQGLALALLYHTFNHFWEMGHNAVILGVDATSLTGATKLYEKAGMYVERQGTSWEKELRPGEELATTSLD